MLVSVFTEAELDALLAMCKGGGGFHARQDATAIISLFGDTGVRLAGLPKDDPDLHRREPTVTGEGRKQRTVKFAYYTSPRA